MPGVWPSALKAGTAKSSTAWASISSRYLVAPVMEYGQRAREVYLPAGTWEFLPDGTVYPGGQTVSVTAPLDRIPVFLKKD